MMRRMIASIVLAAACCGAAAPPGLITVSGQLLDVASGFAYFTTGDAFRLSPHVRIVEAETGAPAVTPILPRTYARATFAPDGEIVELALSKTPLPEAESFRLVQRFAVSLSPTKPNPALAPPQPNAHGYLATYSGKPVLVTFMVRVPPTTPLTATVYMATDASGWNPEAIRLERVDALHFRIVERLRSGTVLRYLYTRGSLQSEERAENGLQRPPREVVISDATVRTIHDVVYRWADQSASGELPLPQTIPTPYNPAPFPNLPPGMPTPHPGR
jgi:hypothetical protein